MSRLKFTVLLCLCLKTFAMASKDTVEIRIIQTSDVHGSFFPYDFINRTPCEGSMARISSYVKELRKHYGDNLLLLDNGDILQGQPTCYYCNFVKPEMPNVAASVINYMKYDAQTIGNHDIETGHAVYDKWIGEVKCDMLGANVIDRKTDKPYLRPYKVFNKDGVKVAVIGMLTPAIPSWLNESLWSGLQFNDMLETARYWVNYLNKNEHPDFVIGLFHSGWENGIVTDEYKENASKAIAENVPGFDLILYGHDHRSNAETVKCKDGHNVLCLNPSASAYFVSDATLRATVENGKVVDTSVSGSLKDVSNMPIDNDFMAYFKADIDSINAFVNRKIGTFKHTISTRDSYFGNSAFCDFIHDLQLKITHADISFNAPLSFDTSIKGGDVHVSDMFNLYKYENQIYALRMTGKEIKNYLEMSYGLWTNTMKNPSDHIMLIGKEYGHGSHAWGFKNLAFNFDSAAGIDYEVDVTKEVGNKVKILRMSDGRPFDEAQTYTVAMNSYRGNGGGELLTKGAGIPRDSIKSRIIFESERDQRYYLIKEIEEGGVINPEPNSNWKFVPSSITEQAIVRDKKLLFGE